VGHGAGLEVVTKIKIFASAGNLTSVVQRVTCHFENIILRVIYSDQRVPSIRRIQNYLTGTVFSLNSQFFRPLNEVRSLLWNSKHRLITTSPHETNSLSHNPIL